MKICVCIVNSFTKSGGGGNPAGVILNADCFSENTMQKIAYESGLADAIFVQKSDRADFKTRFFTPCEEVDLCGHATVSAFHALRNEGVIGRGLFKQETKAGVLGVETDNKERVFMQQKGPEFFETFTKADVVECLNISDTAITEMPIQVVSTASRDLMIPIKDLKSLFAIKPNFEKMKDFCSKNQIAGFQAFTCETKTGACAHCRNFAPLCGINEESATGVSAGALGCYLFKRGVVKKDNMIFEQGYCMNRPSEIIVKLNVNKNRIKDVFVGGSAKAAGKKEIVL